MRFIDVFQGQIYAIIALKHIDKSHASKAPLL